MQPVRRARKAALAAPRRHDGRRDAAGRAGGVARRPLESLGAEVLLAPTIRIVPRPLDDEVRRIARLPRRLPARRLHERQRRRRSSSTTSPSWAPAPLRWPALPPRPSVPATAGALQDRGLTCDVVPEDYVAEGLLEALERHGVGSPPGARVLIPRAREARTVLPDTLREHGALVDVLAVYDTLPADELAVPVEADRGRRLHHVHLEQHGARVRAADRGGGGGAPAGRSRSGSPAPASARSGPITSATLREHGLPVGVEATTYTTAGLVAAIGAAAGS